MSQTVLYILVGAVGVFYVLPKVVSFMADQIHRYIHSDDRRAHVADHPQRQGRRAPVMSECRVCAKSRGDVGASAMIHVAEGMTDLECKLAPLGEWQK